MTLESVIKQLKIAKNMRLIHSASLTKSLTDTTDPRTSISIIISSDVTDAAIVKLHDYFKAKFPKATVFVNGHMFALTLFDVKTNGESEIVSI